MTEHLPPVSEAVVRRREANNRRNRRRNGRKAALGEDYEVNPIAYQRDKLAERIPALKHAMEAKDLEWEISLIEGVLHDIAEGDDVTFWNDACSRDDAWNISRMSRRDKGNE